MQDKMQITKVEIVCFAVVCAVTMFISANPYAIGVYNGCQWYQHLTYQFFHTSIFHLGANIYVMWFCTTRFALKQWQLLMCLIISMLTPPIYTMPTIGASGIVYAMLGMINAIVLKKLRFASWIALYITISAFLNCNWVIHLLCFILGFITNYIVDLWKRLKTL